MAQFTVDIGGISTTMVLPDRRFCGLLENRYHAFLSEKDTSDCRIEMELLSKPVEQGHRLPTVATEGRDFRISRHDTVAYSEDQGKNWRLEIIPNEFAFDSFLRVLLTLRLLDEDGFLIHASAQVRREKGYIFTGKSEAGKTTISDLGTDNLVLCDELPLVRRINGAYRVFGTPFWGKFGQGRVTESAEVGGLFFLNKAPFNKSTSLGAGKALPRLLQTTLFFSRDPVLVEKMMNVVVDFLSSVPSHDLYFLPEPGVWEAVDSVI